MYSVRGRTGATAFTADHASWGFWNPHSTQRIKLIQFSVFPNNASPAGFASRLRRTSARGTPGSTVTPNSSNDSRLAVAPVSGAVLDLGSYSAQPTLLASSVDFGFSWTFHRVAGVGFVFPIPGGIEIGPGEGVAFIQVPAAVGPVLDVTVWWLEDWL